MLVYIETGARVAGMGDTVAWTFEIDHWGIVGHGSTESDAIANLLAQTSGQGTSGISGAEGGLGADGAEVAERVVGDERVFERDRVPATSAELTATLRILEQTRQQTIALARGATDAQLDWRDPDRTLPDWADWYTARQLLWHIADTESRYYLPELGLPALERDGDIVHQLAESADHVRRTLLTLPAPPLVRTAGEAEWTTVKLLRRLAWHERGELRPLRHLLERAPR